MTTGIALDSLATASSRAPSLTEVSVNVTYAPICASEKVVGELPSSS